jgi:hypothetical protein
VDVLLEGEVDELAAEGDERLLVDHADALSRHAVAQPLLDLGVLEVEEVPRVVPDESVLLDGLAPAADLAVRFEDEVVLVALVGERRSRRQPGDAGADDEHAKGVHTEERGG